MITNEVQIAVLQTRMDEMEKNIGTRFDHLERTLTTFIENSENKFSAKWVENAIKWIAVTVFGFVILYILKTVFNG